jgi:hypothetical protein
MFAHEIRKGDDKKARLGTVSIRSVRVVIETSDGGTYFYFPDEDVSAEVVRPEPTYTLTITASALEAQTFASAWRGGPFVGSAAAEAAYEKLARKVAAACREVLG